MNQKYKLMVGLSCIGLALASSPVYAQSLTYSTTAPTLGADDISNFTIGAGGDSGNVDAGNDAATYLAMDRAAIGQTFTTGGNAGGYALNGLWLEQVNYGTTFSDTSHSGVQLTYRLTNPSQAGTAGFVLNTATYNVTGTEPGNLGGFAGGTGSGTWVFFSLGAPITLAANTAYGFDVATVASSPNYFFETAGDNSDVYAGGQAYTTGRGGNVMTTYSGGDHVFDVGLTAVVPEPSTMGLGGLGALALLFRRRIQG